MKLGIKCNNENDAQALLDLLHEKGYTWKTGLRLDKEVIWDLHNYIIKKKQKCIAIGRFANFITYKRFKYLNNIEGDYAVHCPNLEQAKLFLKCMQSSKYNIDYHNWQIFKGLTCYHLYPKTRRVTILSKLGCEKSNTKVINFKNLAYIL